VKRWSTTGIQGRLEISESTIKLRSVRGPRGSRRICTRQMRASCEAASVPENVGVVEAYVRQLDIY
jgi:hypothetical protein